MNFYWLKCVTQLERNSLNNTLTTRETLKINPVPSDITLDVVEQSVCQVLTGISAKRNNLQACHHMRKKDQIVKLNVESRSTMFFLIVKLYKIKVSTLLN